MEKIILDKIKNMLSEIKDITDIKLYQNVKGDYVIEYFYDDTTYIINISEVGTGW